MTVHVETFCNGGWWQNCYLVVNADKEALIVDPGSDADGISTIVESNGWRPLAVINTHAHYDHIGAVAPLLERFDIPFYLHGGDARLLRQANMYKMIFGASENIRIPDISHDLRDLDGTLKIGGFSVEWYGTPGHTPGGVCFKIADHLLTGDTVLPSGVGRTDLPGGDAEALGRSVEILSKLDGNLNVWAGHGPAVTLVNALKAARRSLEKAS